MIEDLEICYWPFARLHEGLELLARESGLAVEHVQLHAPQLTEPPQSDQLIRQSIEGLAHRLGLEAEPVQLTYKQVEEFLHSAGPAILSVSGREQVRFLVLLKSQQNRLSF